MSINHALAAALAALVLAQGCTQRSDAPNDPKKVLNEYISRSFSIKSPAERKDLVELLARDAKSRLEAWSDDQFREAFIEDKRQFIKLVFQESKPVSSGEMSITYELSYLDQSHGHDAKVTQKKLAQMVMQDGHWYIADVRSIKELVEYRNELSLP